MDKKDFDSLQEQLFPASYSILSAVYGRDGESVRLSLSGEESLVLPSEKYALLKLREGDVLTREQLLEFKQVEAFYVARRKALKLLERRAFTAAQLKLKLSEALCPKEIISEVVRDFRERGYLNDEQYAEAWIAGQLRRKEQGRRLLYAGLVRKGVSRQEAERLLASAYPEEAEQTACETLMRKLAGRRGGDLARLLPVLVRRGFPIPLIKRVFKNLGKGD